MIGTFYQTLSLGDLVYMRDWDESVNDWVVVSEKSFIVIDVKHDPSSTEGIVTGKQIGRAHV